MEKIELKKEAARRMRERGFAPEYVNAFEETGAMVLAEDLWGRNTLIHEDDERLRDVAETLWDEKGILAFAGHVEHGHAFGQPVGNVWNLFCVQPEASEWTKDAELRKDGFEDAYVIYPDHAGMERVLTRPLSGALIRIQDLEPTVGYSKE